MECDTARGDRRACRWLDDRHLVAVSRIPLKKALGQHHLRDASRCRRLLEFLGPADGPVVEIGPGGGVLTGALLERGARVWAWELDPAWAFELARRFAADGDPFDVAADVARRLGDAR